MNSFGNTQLHAVCYILLDILAEMLCDGIMQELGSKAMLKIKKTTMWFSYSEHFDLKYHIYF